MSGEAQEVLTKIRTTIEASEKSMKGYALAMQEYATIEAEYKKEKNKAILKARFEENLKNVTEKEAWASGQVEELYKQYVEVEAKCAVKKERLRLQQNILSALQTINSSLKNSEPARNPNG